MSSKKRHKANWRNRTLFHGDNLKDDAEQKDIQRALVLIQQGNHDGAEFIYKRLIEKGTKEYVVFSNLAVIYHMKQRTKEMIVLLKEALRLNPKSLVDLNRLATALKGQGELQAAIECYRKVLAIDPKSLVALNRLATALKERGELQEAIECYKQALTIDPNYVPALNNLGNALKERGELQEAIGYYKKALAIDPNYLLALRGLANALKGQGELQAAIECCRKVLAMDPKSLVDLNKLGAALKEQGDLQAAIGCYKQALAISQEAIGYYKQALAIDPKFLEALSNLGAALIQEGMLKAVQALAIDPKFLDIKSLEDLMNLDATLKKEGTLKAAIDYSKQALAIDPNYLPALINLGFALQEQGELQAAIVYYKQALAIDPNYLPALFNLATTLKEQGELQESITLYQKVISLKEDYHGVHYNLAFVLLLSGDYENGWRKYELRSKNNRSRLHAHPHRLKMWDGCNDSSGNKLLIISESGFGDTLQFMRYIPYLVKRGMSVAFCAKTKLHGLIQASGITTEIYSPEEVHQLTTGEWLPLLSLPQYLNVRPDNPVVNESYIKAPKENILFWKQKLSSETRPIIGICWQGDPGNEITEVSNLRGRSLPLKTFAPIIETIDVSFLSLQKGFGSEQLTDCRLLDRFVGCQEEINQTWDFVETAAFIMNCDLIITTDNYVAHLAAGLGQPTWLLLQKVPEWRWGMEGDTTFWYPSMRLFRQRQDGNWPEVMDRVASALQGVAPWIPECQDRD